MNSRAIIWIIAIIALLGIGIFLLQQNGAGTAPQGRDGNTQNSNNFPNSNDNVEESDSRGLNDEESTFHKSNGEFQGTLKLSGYIEIKQLSGFDNESRDYAFFRVTDSSDDLIYEYLLQNRGNSYVNEDSIGLGCYERDSQRIVSTNSSASGTTESIISGDDLQRLLASSPANPITIQVTKPVPPVGSGAPVCYSHFRNFKF